ncbi:GerAB/ArcD/ProY family transporter [Neobacillus niacini]|uniref:GerAB/ArcD/ProY family transporter n=1 Tax=Neobacillus niacini TaxID=86668 RepID=UPI00204144AC|nr:GerAB/ArcD/ProY family transporter [Neobacillus niacini]MCM3690117.1 spore germination protein [Neobacillus niacini]
MKIEKENISLSQLLTLLINFLLGSAIVVGVGGDAKNDAWLAILLGGLIGIGIITFFHFFIYRFPDKNMFQVFEFCIGRKITIVCTLIYIVYYLYISSRVIRDFGELMATAILPNSPIEMMSLTFCLLMGYILYLGIEVLARTSEIFTPYLFGFFLLLAIFLFASGSLEFKQLQPILGEGVMPVIKTAFTELAFFPYGEMIAFSVIYASLTNKKYSLRVSIVGVGTATLILSVSAILMIVSLGADSVARSNFPLLSTARLVSIGNFIERLDALVVFIIMLGVFIKGSLFFYAGLKGLEYIFKLPYRYFAIPISMIISLFSILVSVDFADHIQEGIKMVPYYLHFPFQVVLPLILFLLVMWKQRKIKSKRKGEQDGTEQTKSSFIKETNKN